jgi:hypothetical protein
MAALLISVPWVSFAEEGVTVGVCDELQTHLDKLVEMTPEYPKIMCVPSSQLVNALLSGILLMIKGDSLIFSGPNLDAK